MRRSNWTPSIVPRWDDHDVYLVVDDLGELGRIWRYEAADFKTAVSDFLEGHYKRPIGIFSFNSTGGWSRDVSGDVAAEARRRCDLQRRNVPSFLQDFIDRHDAVDLSHLPLPLKLRLA